MKRSDSARSRKPPPATSAASQESGSAETAESLQSTITLDIAVERASPLWDAAGRGIEQLAERAISPPAARLRASGSRRRGNQLAACRRRANPRSERAMARRRQTDQRPVLSRFAGREGRRGAAARRYRRRLSRRRGARRTTRRARRSRTIASILSCMVFCICWALITRTPPRPIVWRRSKRRYWRSWGSPIPMR